MTELAGLERKTEGQTEALRALEMRLARLISFLPPGDFRNTTQKKLHDLGTDMFCQVHCLFDEGEDISERLKVMERKIVHFEAKEMEIRQT